MKGRLYFFILQSVSQTNIADTVNMNALPLQLTVSGHALQ
jgi:hypothetical protein